MLFFLLSLLSLLSFSTALPANSTLTVERVLSAVQFTSTFGPYWLSYEELNGPSTVAFTESGGALSWPLDALTGGVHYSILALLQTSQRGLFFGVETAEGNRSVLQFDPDFHTLRNTFPTRACEELIGVDYDVTMMLTACGGPDGVLLTWTDVKSGSVKKNSTIAGVRYGGAALSASYRQQPVVVVLDTAASLVRGLSVDFSPLFTTPLPSSNSSCLIAASQDEAVFYTLCSVSPAACLLGVYNATSGASLSSRKIAESCASARSLSAADDGSREVYFIQQDINSLSHTNGSQIVHDQRLLDEPMHFPSPSSIATASDETVFFAYTAAIPRAVQGIVRMDQTGHLLQHVAFPQLNCSGRLVYPQVAVSESGLVYAPLCNGTVAVFNLALELLAQLYLGEQVVPGGIALAQQGATMFITDVKQPSVVTEYNATTGRPLRTLASPADSASILHIAVNASGDVWGTDSKAGLLYHWSTNGSLIGRPQYFSGSLSGLAVDARNQRLLLNELTYSGEWTAVAVIAMDLQSGDVTLQLRPLVTNAPVQTSADAIAVSAQGRVYLASYYFSTVWEAAPSSVTYTPAVVDVKAGNSRHNDEHRHRAASREVA